MIHLAPILGLARAEARLARRLVRYWVFVVIAALGCAFQFAQLEFVHKLFSWASASAAAANPRYFVPNAGALFLLLFFIGLIFLSFDIRARDKRERIHEVVDALPCSNLEIVLGRALGILVMAWIPLVIISALLALIAWRPLHNPIEPWSLVSLTLAMAVPGYVFTIGLIFLLTLLVRHRLVAALVSLGAIVLQFVAMVWWLPFLASSFLDSTGGYSVTFPSDLLPGFAGGMGLLQRLGFLVAGIGLLLLAVAVHPRKDDARRGVLAGAGAVALLLALLLTGVTWLDTRSNLADRARWRAAHERHRNEAAPDLRKLSGTVRLAPPRTLELDLALTVAAPPGEALAHALFTLNPAQRVERVARAGEGELEFTHADGLLDVRLGSPLPAGEETTLEMRIAGVPDPQFSYLDESIDLVHLHPAEAQIFILGIQPSIFDRRFAALLPGVRWLPVPGSEAGRGDPLVRPADFFELDLTVDAPEGWLLAGPGRRRAEAGGEAKFRFAPPSVVPEVALVGGAFRSRAAEIDGVELEVLYHPAHEGNIEFFADSTGELETWLRERLGEARDVGLDYPYDALTLVEVPNTLRGYGGGWRMGTTLAQPAMILMRESSFPTADFRARKKRFEDAASEDGGVARAKRQGLERFFENDINGGNPFLAAARSFFASQTAGTGPEAVALDFVWETLASQLVTGRRGFFSVHFFDKDFGNEFGVAAQAMNDPNRISDSYADVLLHNILSTNKVWETLAEKSLVDLDPAEDPERAMNVLSLKGGAMAESMLDDLGRERTGRLMATLRTSRKGQTYGRQDVVAAGAAVEADLDSWLSLWVDETALPGFTLGPVRYVRLADAPDGSAQYQLLATVRNGENVPGLFRLEYRLEQEESPLERGEPVRVAARGAVEVGLVTAVPLRMVRVAPYLSLNRNPFNLSLPALDPEQLAAREEPFRGARDVLWADEATDEIVVDDLDPDFAVEEQGKRPLLRVGGRGSADDDLDQGLPIPARGARNADRWSRMSHADAWGRYRRTMAVVRGGEGGRSATFRADLPRAGSWELEYHFTKLTRGKPGTWKLEIDNGGGKHEASFDAAAADTGWSSLGRFDLSAGEVVVRVSDDTEGEYIEADAIRWKPPSHASGAAAVASRTAEQP